jgi:hypothetical protein
MNIHSTRIFFLKCPFTGSIEEHEYFGEVLLGIKQVIQSHLVDISGRFHDKFTGLETEVHRRDEIIVQLQNRIIELEQTTNDRPALEQRLSPGSGSNNSSNELPFMVSLALIVCAEIALNKVLFFRF